MAPRRLTRSDLEILRRSVAASGQLPRDELDRLITEAACLLEERETMIRALEQLGPPWSELRSGLNDLHRTLRSDGRTPHGSETT